MYSNLNKETIISELKSHRGYIKSVSKEIIQNVDTGSKNIFYICTLKVGYNFIDYKLDTNMSIVKTPKIHYTKGLSTYYQEYMSNYFKHRKGFICSIIDGIHIYNVSSKEKKYIPERG